MNCGNKVVTVETNREELIFLKKKSDCMKALGRSTAVVIDSTVFLHATLVLGKK